MAPTEPPKPPEVPMIQVGIPFMPVPQAFHVEKGEAGPHKVAIVTFTSPLSANVVMLDRDAADRLCQEVHAAFSDIEVAPAAALSLIRNADERAKRAKRG